MNIIAISIYYTSSSLFCYASTLVLVTVIICIYLSGSIVTSSICATILRWIDCTICLKFSAFFICIVPFRSIYTTLRHAKILFIIPHAI